MGVVLVWPVFQGMCFLIPLLPFFLLHAFEGATFLLKTMPKKPVQAAILAGFVFILAFSYQDRIRRSSGKSRLLSDL